MSCNSDLFAAKPLYLISDCTRLRLERRLVSTIEEILKASKGKMAALQLREQLLESEKPASDSELSDLIEELYPRCREEKVKLIINRNPIFADDPRIDAIHLGTSSRATQLAAQCREKNKEILLGCSVHSLSELETAESLRSHYALISPLYPPGSKKEDVPLLSKNEYEEILEKSSIPCFALGGINESTLAKCYNPRLSGFAVISAILWNGDPAGAASRLLDCWNKISQ